MLPALNLNAVSADTGKQITAIKTYVNNLKDQIDDELHSISYVQLDADLKKRIDNLSDDIKLAEDNTVMVAELVKATYVTADEVRASYATIGSLNAVSARVSSIEADYIGTEYLEANYVSTQYLQSNYITAGAIASTYIAASAITAEYLNTKFSGSTGLTASRIYCDEYHCNAEGQSYALTPQRLVVGGVSKIIIGA